MFILGLDLSLNCTGFALLKEQQVLVYGNINNKKCKLTTQEKLLNIANIIEPLIIKSDLIKIEDTYCKNVKTLKLLMLVHGMILYFCAKHNKEYKYFTPMNIKKQLLGTVPKTNSKEAVMKKIFKLFSLVDQDIADDNMTDAISIALAK